MDGLAVVLLTVSSVGLSVSVGRLALNELMRAIEHSRHDRPRR